MNEPTVVTLLYYSSMVLLSCKAGYLSRIAQRGIQKAGWTDKEPYADLVTQKKFVAYHVDKKRTLTDEMANLEELVCKGIGVKLRLKYREIIPETARLVTIRIPPDDFYMFQKSDIETNAKIPKGKQIPLENFQSREWEYEPTRCRYVYSETLVASYFYIVAGPMEARHIRGYFILLPTKIAPDQFLLADYVLFYLNPYSRKKKCELIFDTNDSAFNPDGELIIFGPSTELNPPRHPSRFSQYDKSFVDDVRFPSASVLSEERWPSNMDHIKTGSNGGIFGRSSVTRFEQTNGSPNRVVGQKYSISNAEGKIGRITLVDNYYNTGTPNLLEFKERKSAIAEVKIGINSGCGPSGGENNCESPNIHSGYPAFGANEEPSLVDIERKSESSNEESKNNISVNDASAKTRQGIPFPVRKMREGAGIKSNSSLRNMSPKNSDISTNNLQPQGKSTGCEMDKLPEALKTNDLLPETIKDTQLSKPLSRARDNIPSSGETTMFVSSQHPRRRNVNSPPVKEQISPTPGEEQRGSTTPRREYTRSESQKVNTGPKSRKEYVIPVPRRECTETRPPRELIGPIRRRELFCSTARRGDKNTASASSVPTRMGGMYHVNGLHFSSKKEWEDTNEMPKASTSRVGTSKSPFPISQPFFSNYKK